jgi:hypothetical protein
MQLQHDLPGLHNKKLSKCQFLCLIQFNSNFRSIQIFVQAIYFRAVFLVQFNSIQFLN